MSPIPTIFPRRVAAAAVALAAAAPLAAQTDQTLENYSLPPGRATPVPIPPAPVIVLPTPTPTPTPVPTPIAAPPPTTKPAVKPSPRPAAPVPQPTATSIAAPTVAAPPIPATAAAAPPTQQAPATRAEPETQGRGPWIAIAAALLAAGAALAALLWSRRRGAAADASPEPAVMPARAPTPPPPAMPRATLVLDLRPSRAGLNMLSATVEAEAIVTNTGDRPAEAIRLGVALLGASATADADIAAFAASPIARPAAPPFTLAPGETRAVRIVVALARAAIVPVVAAGRPMFAPIVAIACRFTVAAEPVQVARSFVVGIDRAGAAKLAPLWLDAPPRMHDTVAARPHRDGTTARG